MRESIEKLAEFTPPMVESPSYRILNQESLLAGAFLAFCQSFSDAKGKNEYGNSWIKRGPKLAFANLNRKLERFEILLRAKEYDLWPVLETPQGWDCWIDIFVYLMHHSRGAVDWASILMINEQKSEKYGRAWALMDGLGATADITRKIDSLIIHAKSVDFCLVDSVMTEDSEVGKERVRDLMGYMLLASGRYLAASGLFKDREDLLSTSRIVLEAARNSSQTRSTAP